MYNNVSNTAGNCKHVNGLKMRSTNLQKYDVSLFQQTTARFLLAQNQLFKTLFTIFFGAVIKIFRKKKARELNSIPSTKGLYILNTYFSGNRH